MLAANSNALAVEQRGQILTGVGETEYHAQRGLGLVSKSGLDMIARSPAHYKAWCEGGLFKGTKALEFGKAFHCAALEPEKFVDAYIVQPDFGDLRTKEGKANRTLWLENNQGKQSISAEDMQNITGMCSALRLHPAASRLLAKGCPEVTLRWIDEETGLHCKSRADLWLESSALVVDLKSCEDASPEGFQRSVANWRYHVQDALYRAGFAACGKPIQHFALVAVEKEPPYAVAAYTLDAASVAKGYELARANIQTLANCVESNRWDAYSTGVEELSLPRWAL